VEVGVKLEPPAPPAQPSLFTPASVLLAGRAAPLSLGCPLLNRALAGGLRRGAITEVVGESGAGKTQFCLQCTVQAARRGERVVYLCTEGGFPQARLDQMTGDGAELGLVLVQQVRDLHHLLTVLGAQLEEVVRMRGAALLVVDSIAAVIRYDSDLNTGKLERAGAVHRLGQALLDIALKHTLAVLAVNQVTDRFEQAGFAWGRRVVASLGQTWSTYPHTRLWLARTRLVVGRTEAVELQGLKADTRLRTMEVDFSCRLPHSTSHFIVETAGLRGVRVMD
jgi:DNA-repair protein XRCC3